MCLAHAPAVRAEESGAAGRPAPDFPAGGEWIPERLPMKSPAKDRVTMVYFWDYATINCLREIPRLKEWAEVYERFGFEIIFIHAPEFEFARERPNVEKAVRRLGIRQPVYLDNDGRLWEAYGVRSWPTKFLIGADKKIAASHIGEGGLKEFETRIREALLRRSPEANLPEPVIAHERDSFQVRDCGEMSAELYAGYKRADWWGVEITNRSGVLPDQVLRFKDQGRRSERGIFLQGEWANLEDSLQHRQRLQDWTAYLGGIYLGAEVYAVLSGPEKSEREVRLYVRRDDAPVPAGMHGRDLRTDETGETYLVVEEPRLYSLIRSEDGGFHEIRLMTRDPGVSVYAFSFSNTCLAEFEHP